MTYDTVLQAAIYLNGKINLMLCILSLQGLGIVATIHLWIESNVCIPMDHNVPHSQEQNSP